MPGKPVLIHANYWADLGFGNKMVAGDVAVATWLAAQDSGQYVGTLEFGFKTWKRGEEGRIYGETTFVPVTSYPLPDALAVLVAEIIRQATHTPRTDQQQTSASTGLQPSLPRSTS